jgi:TonB-linked SusC/RagA family outer membrane protein
MRQIYLLLSMLLLCAITASAQNRTVTGRVTDAQGNPVPFASVTIKGTNTGVAADRTGSFTLQAPANATLIFSAAGFQESEVNIGTQTTISATLSSQATLNEVVVTALGVRRTRNQVPYAAQQVTGEEVSKTRTNNFVQNLSGKVSGLEIRQGNTLGASTNIVIRGTKTISSGNQPLFVVDGVPIDNSQVRSSANQARGIGGYDYGSAATDINPDDIESLTVLKGAAATSLYGSRGGNGVILITTKKGARGLGITFNSGWGIGKYDKKTFIEYQDEYGAGYGPYYEDPSGFFLFRDINGDGVDDLVVPTSEDASYGARFNPNLMVYHWDAFDPNSPNFGKARPWVNAANGPASFFQSALSSNQSIMINSGTDRSSFKLGYTRTDDRGIMPNSNITKNMVNLGGQFDLSSTLNIGASANFTNVDARGRYGTGYDGASARNLMTNFRQWWQTNVDIKELETAYNNENRNVTWNWADPSDLVPIYWDNPYFTRFENFTTDGRNRLIGNVNANYSPLQWLSFLGRVSHDTYDEIQEERQALGSVGVSGYARNNRTFRETNYDLMANLDRNITTDINLKALAGTNVRKTKYESIYASTNGGLIVERIYALSNSANPPNAPFEGYGEIQVLGLFSGLTFSYRDFLTLDGTIRNDRFSTLEEGNNSDTYYSGSVGFTFSRLIPTATWLSYGKLRANIATVGQGASTPYSTRDVFNIGNPFGTVPLVSVAGSSANPNLQIEKTESKEIGVELAFLNNRAGFDLTYYNAKTFNQIFAVPVSTATGYNSRFLNAGNIRNKGVELSAFGTPIQSRDFSWTINLNWTRNRNTVEELYQDPNNPNNKIDAIVLGTFQGGISMVAALGQPYGILRGTDFVYHENGQPIINQTTGRPMRTPTSNNNIGNPNADWIGGINNSLKYKNLSLSWLVDVRSGGDVFSLDLYYGMATGLYPETAGLNDLGNPKRDPVASGGGIILPGVDPTGKPNAKRGSAVQFGLQGYRYQPNSNFVYDASYVKLREAVLTYSFPTNLVSKLQPFRGIDLSLIGRNLWIIHKNLPYSDPEEFIGAGNLQGYQVGAYPTVRSFTLNLRFKF